jgi:hypothetical protein
MNTNTNTITAPSYLCVLPMGTSAVSPFAGQKWVIGVRRDRHVAATGPSAWSPPI